LAELVFIDTVLLQQPDHGIHISQTLALIVHGLEDRGVGLFELAHAFQSVEQLAMGIPWATEEGRDRSEVRMLGQILLPFADQRLEGEAVTATVPEQLSYLDPVRFLCRCRAGQFDIIDARLELSALGLSQ